MAIPVTLALWQAFASRPDPVSPRRMTMAELERMSAAARAEYDEARIAWLSADVTFATRDVEELSGLVRLAVLRNASPTASARRGLAVSGRSTLGKTTAVLHLGRVHEARERARHPLRNLTQPTIYVVAPPACTPKTLMSAFAHFLGIPTPSRVTQAELTDQVVATLADLRTTLVVLDEAHNVASNTQHGIAASSMLKAFSDRVDATFLYAGIDLPTSDLFTGQVGAQLKGRMALHELRSCSQTSPAGRAEWEGLVRLCDDMVVLARHQPGSLTAAADYLFDRTGGSLGTLRGLVADAAATAILTGSETITRSLLDQTRTDYQAQQTQPAKTARRPRRQPDRKAVPGGAA